jgi:hypothetical protein
LSRVFFLAREVERSQRLLCFPWVTLLVRAGLQTDE